MKTITVDPDKCVGCRVCELVCSLKNNGGFSPAKARIKVTGFDGVFPLPITCFQCDKPYCVEVCPTGAITKGEATGVVRISKERCTGCKICTLACPFGNNIVFSSEANVAVKCELCEGNPECVAFCPTGALEFKEADSATIRKKIALSMIDKKIALSEKLKGIREFMKELK